MDYLVFGTAVVYFFTFSHFATRYNSDMVKLRNRMKLQGSKRTRSEKRARAIKQLMKKILHEKKRSFLLFGIYFVSHCILSLIVYRFDLDELKAPIILCTVFIILMSAIHWMKGSAVAPRGAKRKGNGDLFR